MRYLVPTLLALTLTVGCAKEKPKPPNFVPYESIQNAAINAGSQSAAGSFSDITSRLAAAQEPQIAGTDVQVSDSIVNTGGPASGFKVIIRGTAFDQGIFGAPTRATYSTTDAKDHANQPQDFTLTQDDSGAFKAEVETKAEKQIIVGIVVPAKKGGNADVQIMVIPLDKGGASSASFTHNYTVRSTGDDSENSSE